MKIALIILGFLTLGAIGYVAYTYVQPAPEATEEAAVEITSSSDPESIETSLKELLTLGRNIACTFTSTTDASTTTGNVFVTNQGERMRGDFQTTDDNEEVYDSHIISDGEFTYLWMDSQDQGYKMSIDPEDDSIFPSTEEEAEDIATIDENADVSFSCNSWSPDQSMFVPPSDIEFIDFSQQIESLQNISPQDVQNGEIDCSVCDQAPAGEAQDQCRAALGCS
ncbi:MAG: hypothetical protein WDZ94_02480 [Patescibacteria group bacterium]